MSERPPNIVVLISHDLGCHVGPYGHARDQSPNIDALAREGLRFDAHFVTSPGCSQSRSSLVTGRYPHANGQMGLAHLGWELHRDEILLPQALREAGYHTTLFGIWHLHPWSLAAFDTLSEDVSARDSSPEGTAEIASHRAADWLKQHARQAEPFYLHVGFWETHRPFCGTPEALSRAARIEVRDDELLGYLPPAVETRQEFAELHQSVALVDAGVGRVLDAIDTEGLRENTLVLFTADHGLPFPRAKGTLYDSGIRVALLARWPARVAGGTSTQRLTSNVDVMPTLLDVTGIQRPARIQGKSFTSLLNDESSDTVREAVYAEKTYHEHYDPMRCMRTGDWKYIRNFAERPRLLMPSDVYNSPTRRAMTEDESIWSHRPAEELYDLSIDPGESHNLAGASEHANRLHAMRERLDRWMRQTGDPLSTGPVPRPV